MCRCWVALDFGTVQMTRSYTGGTCLSPDQPFPFTRHVFLGMDPVCMYVRLLPPRNFLKRGHEQLRSSLMGVNKQGAKMTACVVMSKVPDAAGRCGRWMRTFLDIYPSRQVGMQERTRRQTAGALPQHQNPTPEPKEALELSLQEEPTTCTQQ